MTRSECLAVVAGLGVVSCVASCAHAPERPFVAPAATHEDAKSATDTDFVSGVQAPRAAPDEVGLATWYGAELSGHKTTSGERFDPRALTAAHRKLPLGTWVEVRRPDTGRTVRVRINDRGPWGDSRKVIDLSRAAADALDMRHEGVMRVELRVVSGP